MPGYYKAKGFPSFGLSLFTAFIYSFNEPRFDMSMKDVPRANIRLFKNHVTSIYTLKYESYIDSS